MFCVRDVCVFLVCGFQVIHLERPPAVWTSLFSLQGCAIVLTDQCHPQQKKHWIYTCHKLYLFTSLHFLSEMWSQFKTLTVENSLNLKEISRSNSAGLPAKGKCQTLCRGFQQQTKYFEHVWLHMVNFNHISKVCLSYAACYSFKTV